MTCGRLPKNKFYSEPLFGIGYAAFQYGQHTDDLKDTHNWFVKVLVETGLVGGVIALALLQQMLALAWRLFKHAKDPLYQGLGLGLFLTISASIILNLFGDRWTYLEINGLLWALIGTAVSATYLVEPESTGEIARHDSIAEVNPYMAYRQNLSMRRPAKLAERSFYLLGYFIVPTLQQIEFITIRLESYMTRIVALNSHTSQTHIPGSIPGLMSCW